jgi:hypothetical protein
MCGRAALNMTSQIVIIASMLIIVVLMLTTSKNGRKFESEHKTGLYKAGIAVMVSDIVLLLLICGFAFFTLRGDFDQTAGFILMAVFFVCWVPFQFWIYTYIFLDEEGITYFRPSGKSAHIPWKDIELVTPDRLGIIIRSAKGAMRIYAFFRSFDRIKQKIKEHCPGAVE